MKFVLLISFFFLFVKCSSQIAPSGLHISELLFNSTIKINGIKLKTSNDKTIKINETGTGFFYSIIINGDTTNYIVTNKHVIDGCQIGTLVFNSKKNGKPVYGDILPLTVTNFDKLWIKHPREDLAILPLAPILRSINKTFKKNAYFVTFLETDVLQPSEIEEFTAIEDVIMLGYPKGFYDSSNNLPILRRGVTATPMFIDFNNKPQFLLDIPIYPGSSGSPIVIYNQSSYTNRSGSTFAGAPRLRLLGIATESQNYQARGVTVLNDSVSLETKTSLPFEIAIVLKAQILNEFKPLILQANRDSNYQKLFLTTLRQ